MPATKIYEGRAVAFDFNSYPDGLQSLTAQEDFIAMANEECHFSLPPDWYVENYHPATNGETPGVVTPVIVVGLQRYKQFRNLQPVWNFVLTADPVDEDDTQWVVFDVVRWHPSNFYSFQIP